MKTTFIITANHVTFEASVEVHRDRKQQFTRTFRDLYEAAIWLNDLASGLPNETPTAIDKALRDAIPWD